MDSEKFNDWIQVLASIGVIGGLLLVAYELRQNTQQAIGESIRDLYASYRTISISTYETDILEVYAKSIENPDGLTPVEIMKLSAYVTEIIGFYNEFIDLYDVGVTRFQGLDDLKAEVDVHLATRFGRAWFAENKDWLRPIIVETIDHELQSIPIRETMPVEGIKSRL